MNYDLSDFHPDCKNKTIQPSLDGKLYIYCIDCGILADIEAVGMKIDPKDACLPGNWERKSQGDQSPNVHKGGYKK
jgi:hypothetical protein